MTLGERLLILRRVGLSQEGLATASGLNRNTIARLEQNDLQDLSGQSIVKVARALSCTTDVLLGVGELDPETTDTGEPLPPQPARRGRHRRAAAEV
jgi:transcriptional regulator with XRE-family HTH domain